MMSWPPQDDQKLWQLRGEQDASWDEVGNQLGRTASSCRSRYLRLRKMGYGPPAAPVAQAEELAVAVDQMAAAANRINPPASDRAPVTSDLEEWILEDDELPTRWSLAERENARAIARAKRKSHFTAELGDKPVGIVFVSDQHISVGNTVSMTQMREDAELIARTPRVYAILGGDGVDNHIKHRAATLAARSQPDDQYKLFEYYLRILQEKILVMISGNHDAWSNQIAGIDMMSWIAKENRLCYSPHAAWVKARLTGVEYTIAVRHQYRMNSSFNQTHAVKQWFRNGPAPFDIGCVCHHHEPASEHVYLHSQVRWVCRPGSYQITSAYSDQYGYNHTIPTCPGAVIYPHSRRIVGFNNLQDLVEFMR